MSVFSYALYPFCSCDLDLGQTTLKYDLELDILKMYQHAKMKFLNQGFPKLKHKQDRQTQRQV